MTNPLRWLYLMLLLATFMAFQRSIAAEHADSHSAPLLLAMESAESAEIVSLIDGEGRFLLESGEVAYAPGQWVRWGNPSPPARRSQLTARDGSHFVARQDWSTKVPVSLAGEVLTIDHAVFGSLQIPRSQVKLWLLAAASEPIMAHRITRELDEGPSIREDRVWLISGDSIVGEAVAFDGTLMFRSAGEELRLAAADIAAISFAAPSRPLPPSAPNYWIGWDDGTLVAVSTLTIDQNQISTSTTGGLNLTGKKSKALTFVQVLDQIAYLSDERPLDFRHTPYYDVTWPLEIDRNLEHMIPSVTGQRYVKCLAMHSAARAVYQVPHGATHFAAQVAIDEASEEKGSAIFRVYRVVDQAPELTFESPIIRGGDSPQPIVVDLAGASVLILVVDFADYGDERDHCLWLDPRWIAQPTSTASDE